MSLLDGSLRHIICNFLYIIDLSLSAAIDHHLSMLHLFHSSQQHYCSRSAPLEIVGKSCLDKPFVVHCSQLPSCQSSDALLGKHADTSCLQPSLSELLPMKPL